MGFGNVVNEIKHMLSEVTGEAARAAEAALTGLEAEAGKVQATVSDLLAQAKADAEAAVAAAEPEVKAAVSELVTRLEADIQTALAALAAHGL
jgi:F0F1-type ATP synthase membrane subunit b/b'